MDSNAALLTATIFVPTLGALLLLAFDKAAEEAMRVFSLVVTGITFVLTLAIWGRFDPAVAQMQMQVNNVWIAGWNITFSTQAFFLITSVLWLFFLIGMIQPRFDYWRIEPNEFVHYIQPWGRDQSIPRQGSTITREVPDMFEYLLTFGGGTLVIRREGQVVGRIDHVPFLGRRMIAIERMLGATRVRTVDS